MPKHQKASDNLRREKLVLDLIQDKVALKIPKIEYISNLDNDFLATGYRVIEGRSLAPKEFNELIYRQRDNIAKQIAGFLKELHSIEVNNAELIIDKMEELKEMYEKFISKYSDLFELSQVGKIKDFFERIINDKSLHKYKLTLVHNDFSASNLLFNCDTKEVCGVIDFGDVAISDRDNDFIFLLEDSEEEYGREFGKKVLEYYGQSSKEIDLAIRKAEINDELWPYEQILLSEEYGDKEMFVEGLEYLRNKL